MTCKQQIVYTKNVDVLLRKCVSELRHSYMGMAILGSWLEGKKGQIFGRKGKTFLVRGKNGFLGLKRGSIPIPMNELMLLVILLIFDASTYLSFHYLHDVRKCNTNYVFLPVLPTVPILVLQNCNFCVFYKLYLVSYAST